jgi:hypothetical protein
MSGKSKSDAVERAPRCPAHAGVPHIISVSTRRRAEYRKNKQASSIVSRLLLQHVSASREGLGYEKLPRNWLRWWVAFSHNTLNRPSHQCVCARCLSCDSLLSAPCCAQSTLWLKCTQFHRLSPTKSACVPPLSIDRRSQPSISERGYVVAAVLITMTSFSVLYDPRYDGRWFRSGSCHWFRCRLTLCSWEGRRRQQKLVRVRGRAPTMWEECSRSCGSNS